MKTRFGLFALAVVLVLVGGCGERASATPTPTPTSTPSRPYSGIVWSTATAVPTEIPTLTPTPTPPPTVTVTTTVTAVTDTFAIGWDVSWYRSPFTATTDQLTDTATSETFADPGVLLTATAAWDYLSAERTPVNIPEGGYSYIAVGHITITHQTASVVLPWQAGNIYLIVIRGLPDDGTDADLNQRVWLADYPRGFGIYSPMPAGAYVSLGWFLQQVENAQEDTGDPNCGRDGCDTITAVVVDLETRSFRVWEIAGTDGSDPRAWTRLP